MEYMQWVSAAAGLVMYVMIITALLRGHYRRYPLLLALMAMAFLTTIVSAAAMADLGKWTKETQKYYWIGEGIQFLLLFGCQIHMLHQSLSEKSRGRLPQLVLAAIAFVGLATWQAYDHRLGYWMTQLDRNISFGSIFVNLTLWTMLIRSKDPQRLLITAAFGINLAGSAIGHSLRQLSRETVMAGNLVILCSYFIFLFIVWRAVRQPAAAPTGHGAGPALPEDADPDVEHKTA